MSALRNGRAEEGRHLLAAQPDRSLTPQELTTIEGLLQELRNSTPDSEKKPGISGWRPTAIPPGATRARAATSCFVSRL